MTRPTMLSIAPAEESTMPEPEGGKYRACDQDRMENSQVAQQAASWGREKGWPWPKGDVSKPRPQAAPVGHHQQEPALRCQHPPDLAQHFGGRMAEFQRMHGNDDVDRALQQRQICLVDQR